ncbi:MAG: type III-B CRISPR module RAMP protein Cmr6 [Lachnospiraceae bacterium]
MPGNCINMHHFYNVAYFEKLKEKKLSDIDTVDFVDENTAILNYKYDIRNVHLNKIKNSIKNYSSFTLSTAYPGLLIGTGNPHGISAKTGIKSGFSFDYVSGIPVIPGSSVKGVLRSYFPEEKKENNSERENLILELTQKKSLNMEELVDDIFGGSDTFLDAYPVIEEGKERILKLDNITPHKSPVKDPNPITILKIRPNIQYEFLFILKDYKPSRSGEDGLTAKEKLSLFKKLLLLGGAGAKTNVGFGQFSENCLEEAFIDESWEKPTKIEYGSVIECTVKKVFDDKKSAALEYNGIRGKGFDLGNPSVGDKVKIKVTKIRDDGYFLGGLCKS